MLFATATEAGQHTLFFTFAKLLTPIQDLHHDASRDLRAMGCHITVINNCQTLDRETRVSGLAKTMQEGVLFM